MSVSDRFVRSWLSQFPSDPIPNVPCLRLDQSTVAAVGATTSDGVPIYGTVYGDLDVVAVERSLQECNASIEKLHREIAHKQFIANYLWDVLHGINNAALGNDHVDPANKSPVLTAPLMKHSKKVNVKRFVESRADSLPLERGCSETKELTVDDDLLDNPVPLEDFHSPVETNPLQSTGQTTPDSAGGSCNHQKLVSEFDSALGCDKKEVGSKHPLAVRKNSLPLLDHGFDQEDEERYLSLDSQLTTFTGSSESLLSSPSTSRSGAKTGHRQKPVPTPRMSVQKLYTGPASVLKIDSHDSNSSTSDYTSPTDSAASTDLLDIDQKRIAVSGGKVQYAVAPKPPPKVKIDPLEENKRSGSVKARAKAFDESSVKIMGLDVTVAKEISFSSKRQAQQRNDYEEAAPFRRDTADSEDGVVSSDDEEPLYYNMMLLKEQALNRAQTWYAKAVKPAVSKKTLESPAISPSNFNPTAIHMLKTHDAEKSRSSDSIRSNDSDSAFDEKDTGHSIAQSWRKRTSLYCATDSPGSQSESDDLDTSSITPCPDNGMLQMRKWVVTSVFESERAYLNILDILMQYMQTFRNLQGTAQIVLATCDIDCIFFGIADLHKAHKFFVHELEPVIANWSAEQQIAEIFKKLSVAENHIAADYLKNYQKAVVTIHRCWQENETFAKLTKKIQVKGMEEKPTLEELLHKPVVRFQRNTLVLHDLVKSTPTSHADYDLLQKTLSSAQHFIENFDGTYKDSPESQRYLAKQGLIVEKVGSIRKLRHIFLFNDILVCARQKFSTKQKINFEPKWHIPLIDLTLDDKVDVDEEKQMADNQQQEIEQLQRKVSELQGELKTELKQSKGTDGDTHRQWSFHNRSKNMEKIKKKLMEQQAAMIKASPRLLFRVHNRRHGRQFTLLMASDYERANWRVCIAGLLSRAQTTPTISTAELTNLLNIQKLPKGGALGSLIGGDDIGLEEELLFGSLNIKIFKLQGLKQAADAYCTVEVDSFSHFFIKAKTRVSAHGLEPVWNEDFDIDLEGAQTVRILCYRLNRDVGTVIGTCAMELSKAWLRGDFLEKAITLSDETSLIISLRYTSREQSMKRSVSSARGGVFGVRMKAVAKREGTQIPLLIAACIEEVEHRGMQEVGIYRISGVTGEIQKLKKAFEKNGRAAAQMVKESEVHVVTGLLKLYFRELPEALFTDALYPNLVTGMGLADPEAKEKYLASQLQQMPEPNHSTVIYVLDHLIRVAQNEAENKMSLQNLATVFGPTLLRPAVKGSETQTMEELFSSGTRDAMVQTTMLMMFFNLRKKGITL